MKRFHVHVAVRDLQASVDFYSTLFGTAPSVLKDDYAKWMLEDPRLNFAISRREFGAGVDHLGIQVESAGELAALERRLGDVAAPSLAETGATCCYAKSDKYWVADPQGVAWEAFRTFGAAAVYGEPTGAVACCGQPGVALPGSAAPRTSAANDPALACCA